LYCLSSSGPCAALVILNVLLFRALKEAQRKREKLFAENRKSESRKLRESNSTIIMLIVVVTVFLCVEIPVAIATLVHVLFNTVFSYMIDENNSEFYPRLNLVVLFTSSLVILSYPVHFGIYCGMSKQFRQTFMDLFVSRFTGNRSTNNINNYSAVTTATNL